MIEGVHILEGYVQKSQQRDVDFLENRFRSKLKANYCETFEISTDLILFTRTLFFAVPCYSVLLRKSTEKS